MIMAAQVVMGLVFGVVTSVVFRGLLKGAR